MNSSMVQVVAISQTVLRAGMMPARVVCWKNPTHPGYRQIQDQYVTHLECCPRDHPDFKSGKDLSYDMDNSFCYGHYDMTFRAAIEDFAARVVDLGEP